LSENIVHTAVVDDCARLACHSQTICEPFKECFAELLEIARLGAVTRHGDLHNPGLLKLLRERWQSGAAGESDRQKLAFVLGWMGHRAADRQMKPIFRSADPDCPRRPTDCSVYQDVFVLREVYGAGADEPYSPFTAARDPAEHRASSAASVKALEDLFGVIWQRAMIRMHTFTPDDENAEAWLENLLQVRARLYVDLGRYAEALADPDPDMVKRFLDYVRFYDRDDPIIRLARALQRGGDVGELDLADALAAAPDQSQYARALARAIGYLQAASDYFEGRLDAEALAERLEIGKPGG
jgi:hypothetical protein